MGNQFPFIPPLCLRQPAAGAAGSGFKCDLSDNRSTAAASPPLPAAAAAAAFKEQVFKTIRSDFFLKNKKVRCS